MKKLRTILIGALAVALLSTLSFANGLNLNSLGSRAQAMGGAFVGLADDFSTIFWNPAGMGFFKTMQGGVYGTLLMPQSKYSLTDFPVLGTVIDADGESKVYPAGLAAFYYPISENLVAGLGVFTPAGLGASWNGDDVKFLTYPFLTSYEWNSKVGMITIAPGLSYRLNDMVSIGATLNINYAMFNINQWAHSAAFGPFLFDLGQYSEEDTGWGIGGTFGILVKPSESLSFGAVLKTPTNVSLKGTASISNFPILGVFLGFPLTESSPVTRDLDWPLQVSGGLSFKPIQGLTINADIQYTAWSKLGNDNGDIVSEYGETLWNVFMAMGDRDTIPLRWKDAIQIRVGGEYMLTEAFALRLGYMYDPAPAPLETMNFLLPNYDFNTLTAGLGYTSGGLQLDLGFEYLIGGERNVSFMDVLLGVLPNAQPGTYKMNLLVPSVSLSYKF